MMIRLCRRIGKAVSYYLAHPCAALQRERIVTCERGFRIWHRHENLIEREIGSYGVWERAETEAVLRVIKPGDICIDVGANIGYFSLLMANAGATVTAFEPTQYGFARLRRNLSLNPDLATRVTPVQLALSDTPGRFRKAFEARFSLRVLAHTEEDEIVAETLDNYWLDRRIDFIKIDVDGYDTNVVLGATRTLQKWRPVIMAEFSQRHLASCGSSIQALADAFIRVGYEDCELIGLCRRVSLKELVSTVGSPCNVMLHHPG